MWCCHGRDDDRLDRDREASRNTEASIRMHGVLPECEAADIRQRLLPHNVLRQAPVDHDKGRQGSGDQCMRVHPELAYLLRRLSRMESRQSRLRRLLEDIEQSEDVVGTNA